MAKVNLNKFKFADLFKTKNPIYNNEYLTNGHFMVKTSILTKKQLEAINTYEQDDAVIKNLIKGVIELEEDKKVITEFTPELIVFNMHTREKDKIVETFNVLIMELDLGKGKVNFSMREDYYNFIVSNKCKVFITNENVNSPLGIYNSDNNFVGIVLPARATIVDENTMTYLDHLKELETIELVKAEEKKNTRMGRCVFGDGIQNKRLKFIKEVDGYKFYAISKEMEDYNDAFIEILGCDYPICKIELIDVVVKKIQDESLNLVQWIKDDFEKRINDEYSWVSIGQAEMFGKKDEAVIHNKILYEKRRIENEAKDKQKELEEKEYLDNKHKITQDIIIKAIESIQNKEIVKNEDITLYGDSRYDSKDTSLVLHLMKLYDIEVPLKTQGWINKALADIRYREDRDGYGYRFFNSSKESTVFVNYLNELVGKINNKYLKINKGDINNGTENI